MEFSERIQEVQPSATLAITSKAKSMIASGEDVVILAAGEPDFDTPEIVKKAAIEAINDGFTKYTPAGGTASLKKAICRKLHSENGLEYSPENIVVSCGAKHSLYNIFQVLCNPGDEILIISPYWLSYPEMVRLASGTPRFLTTLKKNGYKVSPEDIKAAITDKTKAVILNSPSNPAGVVYERAELEAIAKICIDSGIKIISDEIYEKILFDGKKHVSIASISDEVKGATILVNGVSKSFSMTGWRIGYTAGNKDFIKKIQTLQSHSTSNPTSISQQAAECALVSNMDDILEANRLEFEKRRDLLMSLLEGEEKLKPFKPEGSFYLFCDISGTGMNSMTFAEKLLEEKKVAVIPGGPFGEDSSVRISFATSEKVIEEGMRRIKEWVNE